MPPNQPNQRPFSPGFRLDPPSEREQVELAMHGQKIDEYITAEIQAAGMNLGVEQDGCMVAMLLVRLPPGALLDIKPPRIIGQGPPIDHLGIGNTSICLRLTVKKTGITEPARKAWPDYFPPEAPPDDGAGVPETFQTTGSDPAVPMPGGMLGAILGKRAEPEG